MGAGGGRERKAVIGTLHRWCRVLTYYGFGLFLDFPAVRQPLRAGKGVKAKGKAAHMWVYMPGVLECAVVVVLVCKQVVCIRGMRAVGICKLCTYAWFHRQALQATPRHLQTTLSGQALCEYYLSAGMCLSTRAAVVTNSNETKGAPRSLAGTYRNKEEVQGVPVYCGAVDPWTVRCRPHPATYGTDTTLHHIY